MKDAIRASRERREEAAPHRRARRDDMASRLLHMQRAIGNRAVAEFVQARPRSDAPPMVQERTVERVLDAALAGRGRPLDADTASAMGSRFGQSFSDVRVHTGPPATAAAHALNARAFTLGEQVVVADPQFSPRTPDGRRLLAHELAHVVQQRGAPVPVAPAVALSHTEPERHARAAGEAVVAGRPAPALARVVPAAIQREEKKEEEQRDESLGWLEKQALDTLTTGATVGAPFLKTLLHGATVGFYIEARHRLQKTNAAGDFKNRYLALLTSPGDIYEYGKGWLWGFLQGLWSPVKGLIDLVVLSNKMQQWQLQAFVKLIQHPEELEAMKDKLSVRFARLGQRTAEIWAGFKEKKLETINRIVEGMSAATFDVAKKGGKSAAAAVFEFVKKPWGEIGEGVGKAVGTIAIEAALAFGTEGIGNALAKLGQALERVAPTLMKGVNFIVKEVRAIVAEIHTAIAAIKKGLASAGRSVLKGFEDFASEASGAFDDIIRFFEKLLSKADDAAAHAPAPHVPAPHMPAAHVPAPKATLPTTTTAAPGPRIAEAPRGPRIADTPPGPRIAEAHTAGPLAEPRGPRVDISDPIPSSVEPPPSSIPKARQMEIPPPQQRSPLDAPATKPLPGGPEPKSTGNPIEDYLAKGGEIKRAPIDPATGRPAVGGQPPKQVSQPREGNWQEALGEGLEDRSIQPGTRTYTGMADVDQHHVFPKERKYRKWFEERGMTKEELHSVTVELDKATHQAIHGGGDWTLARRQKWAREWNSNMMRELMEAEKLKGSQLTPREIWDVGYRQVRKYNLPPDFAPYRGPWT